MSETRQENENHKRVLLVAVADFYERNYASMLLQRFGYHVFAVDTAKEAAEFVFKALPRLVLADERVVRMQGRDIQSNMKQEPKTSAIPLILLTSADEKKAERLFSSAGYASVLSLPLQPEALYRAVQKAIEDLPRGFIRMSASLDARLGNGPGEFVRSSVVLSENGMFLRTTITKPAGSRVTVSFVLMERTITTDAFVLYSHGFDEYPQKELGIGLRFETLSDEDKAAIRLFIHNEIGQGIAKK